MTHRRRIGSICTGYGGLDTAASHVFGGEVAWTADPSAGPAAVISHHYPDIPNHGDITTIDWHQIEPVDILTAGFPCQDISYAGKGAGIREGTRSGIWKKVATAIDTLQPGLVVLENVAAITTRRPGLDVVLSDLATIGFDAEWCRVRASDVGAPHRRERWFCLAWPTADATDNGRERSGSAWEGWYGPSHDDSATAYTESIRWYQRWTQPAGQQGRSNVAERGGSDHGDGVQWGRYGPAVARWEQVTGRPAPKPTEPGRNGPRLSARFVEWMMGLPSGHVTGVPDLSRARQIQLIGNGVVPLQGVYALEMLRSVVLAHR